MSKALQTRPSEVLRITDEFIAYAFDSAVILWGTSFDAAISEAVGSAKNREAAEKAQMRVIRRWLPVTRKYAEIQKR
jgi:hypothetical protein